MRTLAILPFLALSPLAAAQNVQPGDVVALSTFSPAGADHGSLSIAMNETGDAFLAWEATVDAPGQPNDGLTRIEGAYLRRFSNSTWRFFPTEIMGEADPAALGANQVFLGGDTCGAPSVGALDDDFVIVWTRSEVGNPSSARLESAVVKVEAAGAPVTYSEMPGIGYLVTAIDASGNAGQADVLGMSQNEFMITYVTHVGTTDHAGVSAFDFELRTIAGDLPQNPGAPLLGASVLLDDTLACDDLPGGESQPAAVEPSTSLDAFGNLVVAYADYRCAERRGLGFDQRGEMEVARFAPGTFALLSTQSIHVRNNENLQRSAHLARSSSNATISLAMTDVDIDGANQNQVGHYDLDFASTGAANVINFQVGLKSWQPVQAEALQHRGLRVALTDLDFNGTAAIAYKRSGKSWEAVNPLLSIAPKGLVLGHLETDPADPAHGWAILMTRGTSSGDERTTMMITRL